MLESLHVPDIVLDIENTIGTTIGKVPTIVSFISEKEKKKSGYVIKY